MIKMHLRSQGTARIICKYLCSVVITTLVLHSQSPSCVVHAQTQTCLPTSGCYPPIQDILKDPLDSFPSRTLTVSSTCDENSAGDGSYLSLGGSVSTFTCTNANVQPNNMLDNETTEGTPTYWQSKNMVESSGVAPEQQSVVFNFTDEFILHLVTVKFAALHVTSSSNSADARPASWTIDTFNSETSSWTTMRSFAKDCASSFPGTPLFDPFASNTDYRAVLCVQYIPYEDGDPFYDDDNYVEYNPGSFDTFGDLFKVNPSAAKFFSTTAIRLNFLTPPSMVPLKS
ncbi:uncharacterized protein LOC101850246, partial [Aplysia californica]|uniref:Uncharacterized protein LOC101850246 n=1 Tax=Aplysia californica TaxID=6500 RepID=A0ABM0JQG2_APLCA